MQDLPFSDTGAVSRPDNKNGFPAIDVAETAKELIYIIYLPGVDKHQVQLASYGEYLVVRGSRALLFPEQVYKSIEGHYGEFERKIKLPEYIVPAEAAAKFMNGVLFVSYSKSMLRGDIIPIE
nr:Hsp20/alpha crystallin family protein [Metabacillus kandeliae]